LDNCKAHPLHNDPTIKESAQKLGLDVVLSNQPANSPDNNIEDLSNFRAIQTLQQEIPTQTLDELIAAVEEAYWLYPIEKCENAWLTLQSVLECVILHEGSNTFKLPHMGKAKLRRQNKLPKNIKVSQEALIIGSKYRPELSKFIFDCPVGLNAASNLDVTSSIDFDYNHGGSDGDDEQEFGDDESELLLEEDEFGTAAFFVDKENVPPKMPRSPTAPRLHVLKSGCVIEQSIVEDFFMVATHDKKFMIDGECVAMLETAFYDMLIKYGWNDGMKSRFFRNQHQS
jgi:hypothetical protein